MMSLGTMVRTKLQTQVSHHFLAAKSCEGKGLPCFSPTLYLSLNISWLKEDPWMEELLSDRMGTFLRS